MINGSLYVLAMTYIFLVGVEWAVTTFRRMMGGYNGGG